MHSLELLKGNRLIDITPILGPFSRRSNSSELGEEISFSIATAQTPRFPKNPCDIGDLVILKKKGKEITRAVIVDETKSDQFSVSYSAFDYAFYLNKSNAIYKFKKVRSDAAIKKILRDFNIPVGNVVSIPVLVDKIFNDVTVSSIIEEILEMAEKKNGIKHVMEMRQGKLYIERQRDKVIVARFKLHEKGDSFDATIAIANPSRKRSIVDMVNVVQVVGEDDKLLLTRKDNAMMRKYGRLQKVVKLDKEEKKSAATIAANELKELSKVVEESSIELLGDDSVRAGRLLKVNEPITGLKGLYLIKDVTHTYEGGIHKMQLGLEASGK